MRRKNLAFGLSILGLVALFVFLRKNDSDTVSPTVDDGRIANTERGSSPLSPQQREAAFDPVLPSLATHSPQSRDPQDWSGSVVLDEWFTPQNDDPGSLLERHRILDDQGFPFPIYIVETRASRNGSPSEDWRLFSSFAANQIVLTAPDSLDTAALHEIAEALGWKLLEDSNSPYLAVLETESYDFNTVRDAISAIEQSDSPFVAEPNHIYYTMAIPNDPRFTSSGQWGLHQSSDFDIDAPEGWTIRTDASSVTLAIVDTGIRLDHEDLRDNLWINAGDATRDGSDNDRNGYVDDIHGVNTINRSRPPEDDNGHGTHVAGIAGAIGNNNRGIAGVAWKVKLMAIKSLNADGRGAVSAVAAGIDYAVETGADIINASLGSDSYSSAIESAIRRARDKGVLFVAAAGNEGSSSPSYPASSGLKNVVAVGSVSRSGSLSSFSNYSSNHVDVLAPGDGILSTWHETSDAYATQQGTSMASPVVAGLLALNLAEHATDDYSTQIDRLIVSSKRVEGFDYYSKSGGIVSLNTSLLMDNVPTPPRIIGYSETYLERYEGESATFSVSAESRLPLSYQWYLNDVALSDETNSSITIETVDVSNRGDYTVEVKNEDTSIQVSYSLVVFPRIREIEALASPEIKVFASHENHWEIIAENGESVITNREIARDQNAFLRFRIDSKGLLRVVARRGVNSERSINLSGPENYHYVDSPLWDTYDLIATYNEELVADLRLNSWYFAIGSESKSVYIKPPRYYEKDKEPPTIDYYNSYSTVVKVGERAYLFVEASGQDLQYQWYKDDLPIAGATNPTYEFQPEAAEDGGVFYVVVSNSFGSTTSRASTIEIDLSPLQARIEYDIEYNRYLVAGEPLEIAMTVYGTQPIRYQWLKDGVPIPGASDSTLRLGPAEVAHSGQYRLTAENYLNTTPNQGPNVYVSVTEQIFPPRFQARDKSEKFYVGERGMYMEVQTLEALGSNPIDYTWYKDGLEIESEFTGTSIYLPELSPSDEATYYLEAKNSLGIDQSGRFHISVTPSIAEAVEVDPDNLSAGSPKSSAPYYAIYQTEETWDGIDALEFSSEPEYSYNCRLLSNDDDRLLKFRWKLSETEGAIFKHWLSYSETTTILETRGEWLEETVFIPAGQEAYFVLEASEHRSKLWLDHFEFIESPTITKDIHFTPPRIGASAELRVNIFAPDAQYQWYKDGVAVAGANSQTLTIDSFASTDAGSYHLTATNNAGSVSSSVANVDTDLLTKIVADTLSYNISEASNVFIKTPDDETASPYLSILLNDQDQWSLETQISGPIKLELEYDLMRINAHYFLDGNRLYQSSYERPGGASIFIPKGTHTLSFELYTWRDQAEAKIFSIDLVSEPFVELRNAYEEHYGTWDVPFVEYAGIEPLRVEWYKNGERIKLLTNVQSGSSFPFEREVDIFDHGTYQVKVTDANEDSVYSNPYVFSLDHMIHEITDTESQEAYLDISADFQNYYFDKNTKKRGNASVRFVNPYDTYGIPQIRLYGAATYFKLWIKTDGLEKEGEIVYYLDDERKTLAPNYDWQQIEVGGYAHGTSFQVVGTNEDSVVWIDDIQRVERAYFLDHPKSVATYFGANVRFYGYATEIATWLLDYQWLKDGEPIPGANESFIEINPVTESDLGRYELAVNSTNGDFVVSESASLSILEEDFGAAIGYPGARVTTYGDAFWSIDYENSFEGPSSLISGELEPDEISSIEIEVDGPASWGLYRYDFNDSYEAAQSNWSYYPANYVPAGETGTFSMSESGWEGIKTYTRLDGFRLSRFGTKPYEQWIDERLAGFIPLSKSSKDRNSDPDNDGIPNWLEFALSLDPSSSNLLPKFGIEASIDGESEARIQFYASRSKEYLISYEASFDLKTWSSIKPRVEVINSTVDFDEIKATLSFKSAKNKPFFVRWSITHKTDRDDGAF